MGLARVNPGKDLPNEINVIIEIPAHSEPIKYEVEKESGAIFVDRFMSTAMHYPCDYGYVPDTLSDDGDPCDVLVITPLPINRGCVVRARPVGMLKMTDEAGMDYKILAVPVNSLTPLYKDINEFSDLPKQLLDQISHFFTHYKDLEEGKWARVENWLDSASAKKEILACVDRLKQSTSKASS